jgi:uncharacterized protein YegL
MGQWVFFAIISFPEGIPQNYVLPTTSTLSPTTTTTTTTTTEKQVPTEKLEVTSFHVTSRIQLRYARTVVETRVRNPDQVAQLADFNVVIPDSAFISNFSMEMRGEEFVARVEEKEKAERTFQKAASRGRGAGLVSQDSREANSFTVAANVEGEQEILYRLTYDELLERKAGMYELSINIDPKQVVEDFWVKILINESLPITMIKVPELLESNEIDPTEETKNSFVDISKAVDGDVKRATVLFAPTRSVQEAAADQGLSGRLVVRYDVDRQGQDSEVQVIDGYFVHYFVPENLETLAKHAIFILDTSGSMLGEKMQQLKDAMFTVLDDMTPKDFFTIITFSSDVKFWSPDGVASTKATAATQSNKKAAIDHVLDLEAEGGTNINAAILAGLQQAERVLRSEELPPGVASMRVFLSDGEATEGETSGATIQGNIASANLDLELPIFSVAFGSGADFDLLKDISVAADSFAKRVYEGSDAALQLESFYTEISSPLVTNLKFNYVGGLVDNASLTETGRRTLFRGGQYVVAGKLLEGTAGGLEVRVTGERGGEEGRYAEDITICLRDTDHAGLEEVVEGSGEPIDHFFVCRPSSIPRPQRSEAQEFIQSLYAFLNLQQLLKRDQKAEAVALALENNFVTPVTSLVVVRPDEEDSLATVEEPASHDYDYSYSSPTFSLRGLGGPRIVGGGSYQYGGGSGATYPSAASGQRVQFSSVDSVFESAYSTYDDDYAEEEEEVFFLSTTTVPTNCAGNLTLYDSTYHRGELLVLLDSSEDLGAFSDRAVSAAVAGSCCWTLYAEPGHSGPSVQLRPGGSYRGTDSFGRRLFREVSSALRVVC